MALIIDEKLPKPSKRDVINRLKILLFFLFVLGGVAYFYVDELVGVSVLLGAVIVLFYFLRIMTLPKSQNITKKHLTETQSINRLKIVVPLMLLFGLLVYFYVNKTSGYAIIMSVLFVVVVFWLFFTNKEKINKKNKT